MNTATDLERNIPLSKLEAWVNSATTGDQRLRRKRWATGYIYGASIPTMVSWQQHTVNTDGIVVHHAPR